MAVIASSPPLDAATGPPPSSSRTGTRTLSLPANGATTNDSSVIGRKRRPACSGSIAEHVLDVEREVQEHREASTRRPRRRRCSRRRTPGGGTATGRASGAAGGARRPGTATNSTAAPIRKRDDPRRAPALFVALDEREHEQEQRPGERDQADPVDARGVRVARLADLGERQEHGGDADRHVDEEDPFPADARGDDAAEHRADGDGGADHGAEDAERGAALLAVERLRRSAPARWRTSSPRRCPARRGRG